MFDQKTLAIITKVVALVAVLFIVIPAAIWLLIKYLQFLGWAGGL